MIKNVLLIFFMISFNVYSNDDYIYAPFGFKSRQPPTSGAIQLLDVEMGIKAQQVCGYTDWSSVQLKLPKELLSKTYWKNIGKNLEAQAIKSVMDISGALPSMLACNASATFCQVMNQAELMAGFESQLTWNTCDALEGVKNTIRYGDVSLAICITKRTNEGASPSRARELCINGESKSGSGEVSKTDKIENSSESQTEKPFDINKFYERMFPLEANETDKTGTPVKTIEVSSQNYTRIKKEKELAKMLFPGIDLSGKVILVHGGSFSPPVERLHDDNQSKAKRYIIELVHKLNDRYIRKGMTAKQALRQCVKDSVCDWEQTCDKNDYCSWTFKKLKSENKIIPPILLESSDPSIDPSFLVTPEQIIALTVILNSHDENLGEVKLDMASDRLASSISYLKTFNLLSGIQRKSIEACRGPDFNGEIHQRACREMKERTQDEMIFLKNKRDSEDSALKNQGLVNEMIINSQMEKSKDYSIDEKPPGKTTPGSIQ